MTGYMDNMVQNTVELCVNLCWNMGFNYAGLEVDACACDNNYGGNSGNLGTLSVKARGTCEKDVHVYRPAHACM